MKKTLLATIVPGLALGLMGSVLQAAGLDRSGQSIAPLFSENETVTFSTAHIAPLVTGEDTIGATYSAGVNYTQTSLAWTNDLGDRWRYMVMFDQPFGVDVTYGDTAPATSLLGGTEATLDSMAMTFVGQYKVTDRFGLHAGASLETIDAEVTLNGRAYAAAIAPSPTLYAAFMAGGGYNFEMDQTTKLGPLVGASYEMPDIGLRLSGTYRFAMTHDADITETITGLSSGPTAGEVSFDAPQSFTFEGQTGIAQDTLLTLKYRWIDYSAVDIVPGVLGQDLVNLDDKEVYSLGIARRLSEKFVGSLTYTHEPATGSNDQVSPLAPRNGRDSVSLGARYANDGLIISGGISYSYLGDADAAVGTTTVARFEDNHSVAVGIKAELGF